MGNICTENLNGRIFFFYESIINFIYTTSVSYDFSPKLFLYTPRLKILKDKIRSWKTPVKVDIQNIGTN